MTRYYNRQYTSAPIFNSGNNVFLDTTDIHIIYLLARLVYQYLELYTMEK